MYGKATILAAALLAVGLLTSEAAARNPAYYGTSRGVSARVYSGEYQAYRPNPTRTFTLPTYGNGFRTYYRGRGYHPYYAQPVVVYPPVVYYGF